MTGLMCGPMRGDTNDLDAERADSSTGVLADVLVLGDATSNASFDDLGGKAANLDIMLGAGLPVPATAVVTTQVYRRCLEHPELAALIARLIDDSDGSVVDDREVDETFAHAGMPDDLRARVLDARHRIAPGTRVAVRSSATTEDLGGASFAGQYLSVVDIDTDDDVIAAVLSVWASLWHRAPRLYRHLHGFDHSTVAMAVIIQEMVPAARAGVVFTVNPEGPDDHLRVEHVTGLGEALVSGAVTPTATVVPRARLDSLPDDVRVAAELAMRAEEVFGDPQDVEWADDGERTVLVQSRPITTTAAPDVDDGFDTPVRTHRRYTTAGIAEMLPGVYPVLSWSTAAFMVEEAFRQAMDLLGALPSTLVAADGFVVRLRGRAALDLGHLADVADELPGGSAAELEQQYFGVSSAITDAAHVPWRDRLRHDLRVLASSRHARRDQAVTGIAIESVLDSEFDIDDLDDRRLLALRARLVDLGVRATAAEFNVAAAAAAASRRLEDTLVGHLGEADGALWTRRVTARTRPTTIMATASELRTRIDADAPEIRTCETWQDAAAELDRTGHESLSRAIDAGRERAGCQRVVGGPAWDEEPDRYWHLVRDAPELSMRPDLHADVAALERELTALPGWTRTRILTGQVVDVRRQLVRRLVRNSVDLLERREFAKAALLSLGGRIRAIDLQVGARLTARGALLRADDVVHLHPSELHDSLLDGAHIGLDLLLRRRRCIERWESDDELPLTFTGHPPDVSPTAPSGDRFDGWGASPGRHTGTIRHLETPDETAVEPGDVVVALRTDASWSPVFVRAAAIVVEQGGPLSHAAIVARELGLPAVVNVPGIVARLRDESHPVTVDGDLGAVFVRGGADASDGGT